MKCRHCGALNARVNGRLASNCWLCGQGLPDEPSPPAADAEPPPLTLDAINPQHKYARSFTLASIFLVTTLIAVCLGVVVAEPGLGIVLAVICLPAFVRTSLVVQRRAALGKTVSTAEKFGWFLGSAAVTVVVAAVVTVASVGTFCAVCLGGAVFSDELGLHPFRGNEGLIWFLVVVSVAVAAVTTFFAMRGMIRWMRRRWRRDIERR